MPNDRPPSTPKDLKDILDRQPDAPFFVEVRCDDYGRWLVQKRPEGAPAINVVDVDEVSRYADEIREAHPAHAAEIDAAVKKLRAKLPLHPK